MEEVLMVKCYYLDIIFVYNYELSNCFIYIN